MPLITGIDESESLLAVYIGDEPGKRIGNSPQLCFALLQSRFGSFPLGDIEDDAGYLPRLPRRVGQDLPGNGNPYLFAMRAAKNATFHVVRASSAHRLANGVDDAAAVLGMQKTFEVIERPTDTGRGQAKNRFQLG